jgi:hypothetical protein
MIVVVIFIAATLGALFGAFAGWVLGFTALGNWILKFLAAIHIYTNMVDFGTFCGFVGGFFSSSFKGKD